MKKEIRLSGSGGQGLILAGVILAEGAIISNLNAVQSQSYGPEARGGASKAEVIISDKNKDISKFILNDLERGCTFIKGVGGLQTRGKYRKGYPKSQYVK